VYWYKNVQQILQRRKLGNQLLHHLGEGLEDGVVVYGGQMETQVDLIEASLVKVIRRPLVYVPLRFHFRVVANSIHLGKEHVSLGYQHDKRPTHGYYLVYKHLELDALVHFVGLQHCVLELGQRLVVVILGIDDKDQGSTASKDHVRIKGRLEEVNLAGEVPDLELHKAGVVDVVLHDLTGRLQEERLVRRHLVEDHFLDGALAGSAHSHQQNAWLCLAAARCIGLQFQAILVVGPVAKVLGERVRRIVIIIVALKGRDWVQISRLRWAGANGDMASLSTHHAVGVYRLPLDSGFGGGAGRRSTDVCMKRTGNGYSGHDQFTFFCFSCAFLIANTVCAHLLTELSCSYR